VDDRLRLIFTCCHPAINREAQLALTLRAVAGLTTPEIARAFVTSEATVAQRIVRAKRKIVARKFRTGCRRPRSLQRASERCWSSSTSFSMRATWLPATNRHAQC